MEERDVFKDFVSLNVKQSVWDHFFTVAPLVVIGTREKEGYDLAPKHMVTPIGFSNFFGFVCTPRHSTYQNILREKRFTVSYVRPDQVLLTSLAAMPRCDEDDFAKDIVKEIPTISSDDGKSIYLADSSALLECKLFKIIDGFDDYSIITGKIIAARIHKKYKILSDKASQKHIYENPLLAYVAQGRFATIKKTMSYPYPKDFKR